VCEGVFEVKVTLEGADEPLTKDRCANEREEDLEKLRERLEREKKRLEEREEVEREMVRTFMLMIDPCQLWSRKKPFVLNHLPNHQSLPSFQSTSRPTAWQRPNASAGHLPGIANTTSSFEGFAVAFNCPVTLAGLPHPPPSVARSRTRSRFREHHRSSHRKSGHKSRRHSPCLSPPTPSHASRQRRDSCARREVAPLPVPSPPGPN